EGRKCLHLGLKSRPQMVDGSRPWSRGRHAPPPSNEVNSLEPSPTRARLRRAGSDAPVRISGHLLTTDKLSTKYSLSSPPESRHPPSVGGPLGLRVAGALRKTSPVGVVPNQGEARPHLVQTSL